MKGPGKGGRNQEFALWCLHETQSWKSQPVLFASLGSDGSDGPTDAAGAVVSPTTRARARELQLDSGDYLDRNDSYHFFQQLDDLIITGPTGTNVMDFHLALVGNSPLKTRNPELGTRDSAPVNSRVYRTLSFPWPLTSSKNACPARLSDRFFGYTSRMGRSTSISLTLTSQSVPWRISCPTHMRGRKANAFIRLNQLSNALDRRHFHSHT